MFNTSTRNPTKAGAKQSVITMAAAMSPRIADFAALPWSTTRSVTPIDVAMDAVATDTGTMSEESIIEAANVPAVHRREPHAE